MNSQSLNREGCQHSLATRTLPCVPELLQNWIYCSLLKTSRSNNNWHRFLLLSFVLCVVCVKCYHRVNEWKLEWLHPLWQILHEDTKKNDCRKLGPQGLDFLLMLKAFDWLHCLFLKLDRRKIMIYELECLLVLINVASTGATELYQFASIGVLQKFPMALNSILISFAHLPCVLM